MRRRLTITVLTLAMLASLVGTVSPASAGGQACVSATVSSYGASQCSGFTFPVTRCWVTTWNSWPYATVTVCHPTQI